MSWVPMGSGRSFSMACRTDEVAEDVTFQREDEGVPAAFQAFEEIGAAESLEACAGPRQIGQDSASSGVGGLCGEGF